MTRLVMWFARLPSCDDKLLGISRDISHIVETCRNWGVGKALASPELAVHGSPPSSVMILWPSKGARAIPAIPVKWWRTHVEEVGHQFKLDV